MNSKALDQLDESLQKAEISMTPLIDMVFILLIFFVVTTTFTKETGITVDKAKASTSQMINDNLVSVAIKKDGTYWCNGKPYQLDPLVAEIRGAVDADSTTNVLIIPDRNGQVEPLITILDRLRAENITRFSLGTDRKTVP